MIEPLIFIALRTVVPAILAISLLGEITAIVVLYNKSDNIYLGCRQQGCPSAGVPNSLTATVKMRLWAWQTASPTDSSQCPDNSPVQATWTGHIDSIMHDYTVGPSLQMSLVATCGPNVMVKTEVETPQAAPICISNREASQSDTYGDLTASRRYAEEADCS